jgi:type II secretory pathway pseudopilin PulG
MSRERKRTAIKMFTTVELLTVMAILAILMAMGLGVYSLASNRMAVTKTQALIQKISVALENYKAKHGYYIQQFSNPGFYLDIVDTSASATDAEKAINNFCYFIDYEQVKNNDTEEVSSGKYALVDGFGNHIIYKCPGEYNRDTFDLCSPGSDSTTTEDDITNWK